MARDVGDALGTAIGRVARETVETVAANARKNSSGPLSGKKGLAAGAGLVALAPLLTKGVGAVAKGGLSQATAPVKDVAEKLGDGDSSEVPGVGKGRRLPVQQAIDVAVPLTTAYNQWTQFEDWPSFMHRLDQVVQKDECHIAFKTKIWGISKEFEAEILEQRPDERIKWRVTDGVSHTGVVTFHQLSDRLTRIEVNIDVHPGSLIEKAARGMRHVKRAVRADLARFKAYIEMEEQETGAWRGVIADGKVKSSKQNGSSGSQRRSSSSGRSSSSARSKRSSDGSGGSSGSGRSRSTAKRSRASSGGSGSSSSRRSSSGSRS